MGLNDMDKEIIYSALSEHISQFWPTEKKELFTWELGRIKKVLPNFMVLRVTPNTPNEPWVYITHGAWEVENGDIFRYEFFILAPYESPIHVETLAILSSYYLESNNKISVGTCINIGREWIEGSTCKNLLVSLPYPYGPDFENFNSDDVKVKYRWLVPIHDSEKKYLEHSGLEALEQKFDEMEMDFLDPCRPSCV